MGFQNNYSCGRLIIYSLLPGSELSIRDLDNAPPRILSNPTKIPNVIIDIILNEYERNAYLDLVQIQKLVEDHFGSPLEFVDKWNLNFLESVKKVFPEVPFTWTELVTTRRVDEKNSTGIDNVVGATEMKQNTQIVKPEFSMETQVALRKILTRESSNIVLSQSP